MRLLIGFVIVHNITTEIRINIEKGIIEFSREPRTSNGNLEVYEIVVLLFVIAVLCMVIFRVLEK